MDLKNILPQMIAKRVGKIMETANPTRKSSLNTADTCPARDGPIRQPKSPAKASIPNIKTPPWGSFFAAILNEPGHIMPAPIPQRAQPNRERAGKGETTVMRYEKIQMICLLF